MANLKKLASFSRCVIRDVAPLRVYLICKQLMVYISVFNDKLLGRLIKL